MNGSPSRGLRDLQVIAGLIAGIGALIYVTGGAAFAARLLWAGLPALPVAQMPREFLISVGLAQIVMPALALGLIAGLIELGQDPPRLLRGHKSWGDTDGLPSLRRTYIAFYSALPFVLITPAIAIAVLTDKAIEHPTWIVLSLVACAAVLLLVWIVLAILSRKSKRNAGGTKPGGFILWSSMLGGLAVSGAWSGWLWSQHGARYAAITGAWIMALLFALLVVWMRGTIGHRARINNVGQGVHPVYIILSWTASALLAVPALVAITAALPLSDAVVCAVQGGKDTGYVATGRFVGETKDRVFIGYDGNGRSRIISIPSSKVSRVVVGEQAAKQGICDKAVDDGARG